MGLQDLGLWALGLDLRSLTLQNNPKPQNPSAWVWTVGLRPGSGFDPFIGVREVRLGLGRIGFRDHKV